MSYRPEAFVFSQSGYFPEWLESLPCPLSKSRGWNSIRPASIPTSRAGEPYNGLRRPICVKLTFGLLCCLSATACGTAGMIDGPSTGSGVAGSVKAGPTCPGGNTAPTCAPAAVTTTVRLVDDHGATVASGRSDEDGRYHIAVPPGRYVVEARTSSPGRGCQPVRVQVVAGRWARANVSCDTGIRSLWNPEKVSQSH